VLGRGSLLGRRYRLRRELDGGPADATEWEAHDTVLDRTVLVELLPPPLVDDPVAAERFRARVRLAAHTAEPGRPRILDAGDDEATRAPFAVFEWQGDPLDATAPIGRVGSPDDADATRPLAALAPSEPRRSQARPADPAASPRDRPGRFGVWGFLALVVVVGVVVLAGLTVRVGAGAVGSLLAAVPSLPSLAAPARPAAAPSPPPAPATPTPAAAAAPTRAAPPAAASPTSAGGQRRRVANTDGQGVALRSGPDGDRLPGRGYDEGATVTLLGESADGKWAHIRGDDGREGWVLAVTLVPAN
jgi:Bacterial SH3 domain